MKTDSYEQINEPMNDRWSETGGKWGNSSGGEGGKRVHPSNVLLCIFIVKSERALESVGPN